jgi:hypothetical protein
MGKIGHRHIQRPSHTTRTAQSLSSELTQKSDDARNRSRAARDERERVLHGGARLDVAVVQVAFESKGLEPVSHVVMVPRVETRRLFPSYGQTECNVYRPALRAATSTAGRAAAAACTAAFSSP